MAKVEVEYTTYLREALDTMAHGGLLLACADEAGRPNAMTIGWGTVGVIWGKPIFVVLVRPSRYTYELIEKAGAFTVNVPTKDLKVAVAFCGTVSGREYDKFAEKGLTAIDGEKVGVPSIEECVVHYECKVVHKNDVLREVLDGEIDASAYPAGDYHRLYYGEILGTYATEDAAEKLGEA